MAEDDREPARGAMDFRPSETGVNAGLIALLMHLIAPAFGNVRRTDADWPAIDPYRIGHPSQSGWPVHLAYGLLVALAIGSLVGGAHWAV